MRSDLGRLGDERGVNIDHSRPGLRKQVGRAFEDIEAGHAANGFIGVREVMTDVAATDRSEKRIGDGVRENVGVGMAFQAEGMGNLHAAED